MAGIYFHIPFCKTRCVYCDFFSSTNIKEKMQYVDVLCKELFLRKNYLNDQQIKTIYFGGGTPSLLTAIDYEKIFTILKQEFNVDWKNGEITLEANPDDITHEYLESIAPLPFNRISIGIQSFDDNELKFLKRRHGAAGALQAIWLCQQYGFDNVNIDLMYGLPRQSLEKWEENIKQAINLNIQHISAYHLIYEEGTRLDKLLNLGLIEPIEEELSNRMFETLIDMLEENGFQQYEISNFARQGFHSRHNSSYWNSSHYLGIGISAHSYNGSSRQWNKDVAGKNRWNYEPEIELIDKKIAYNDFVITRLRTIKGLNLQEIQKEFGIEKKQYVLKQAEKYLRDNLLVIQGNYLRLTRKGIFISDGIMSDLME